MLIGRSDADVSSLTYFVLDVGKSWQMVSYNIKDTQVTLHMAELPGSSMAFFRVITTDQVI
jgi:hypothetical protein